MSATDLEDPDQLGATPEETDSRRRTFAYGHGRVPWYLVLLYLSFVVFFLWYALAHQLPDYLLQGPGRGGEPPMHSTQ
jgi:hypothetical protein